ncbi:MAG: hypothetical protein HUU06_08075 [Planctomycetaceae bacterium]|nr:hypothetical protein [Planctomycetota bacterium]NUN52726.1 hypothetical protein [Planctomycetaceae bacterium]
MSITRAGPWALLLPLLLAAGCAYATMQDAVGGRGEGTSAVYPVTPSKASALARRVIYRACPFDIQSSRDGSLLTCEASAGPDTTFIAVWIDPGPTEGESVVTIRSVKRSPTQIMNRLPEDQFHAQFRAALEGKRE